MLRPVLYSLLGFLTLYYIYYVTGSRTVLMSSSILSPWSSPFSGWHTRATLDPNPHDFQPKRELLKLVVLRNAPVETEGFTFAVFEGGVSVDYNGKVLTLHPTDYQGIMDLAQEVIHLPQTGHFRNTWIIENPRTSQPVDRILFHIFPLSPAKANYEEDYKETSVQGFDKTNPVLKTPIEGISKLPAVLSELIGVVLEAREEDVDKDEVVLERVRAILGDVF